jgi:hypothetical protein
LERDAERLDGGIAQRDQPGDSLAAGWELAPVRVISAAIPEYIQERPDLILILVLPAFSVFYYVLPFVARRPPI